MKPSSMTSEQMAAITRLHAELEQQGDYDPLLATLVDEPIFEFHPPGGQLIGGETLRRYYVRFLAEFMPLVEETILIGEWSDERGAASGARETARVIGATVQTARGAYTAASRRGDCATRSTS